MVTSYVKKWGNSLAVRIPKRLSDSLRLREGSPLLFEESDGKILIKPAKDKKQELAASFRRAAKDAAMRKMADEGLADYLNQLKKFG